MKTITKLRRNSKALSPIFATLILIAIAVIAGIVVYMFTSGYVASMTGSSTTGQEKAAVQAGSVTGANTANVYATYVGGGNAIVINGALLKDVNGTTVAATAAGSLTTDGALTTITCTLASGNFVSGHAYSITLTSSKGSSFVSPQFTAP